MIGRFVVHDRRATARESHKLTSRVGGSGKRIGAHIVAMMWIGLLDGRTSGYCQRGAEPSSRHTASDHRRSAADQRDASTRSVNCAVTCATFVAECASLAVTLREFSPAPA